jgi:thymidylate kinase
MLLIVEGLDAVGKSTVAQKLAYKFEYPIIHGSSFELAEKDNDGLFKHFNDLSLANRGVFDRYIWSNLTYAQLFRDYSIITSDQQLEIESKIRNKSKVFYLYAEIEEIKSRLKKRGDEYIDETQIEAIAEKYEEVLATSTLDIVRIDTTGKTSNQVFEEILDEIGVGLY